MPAIPALPKAPDSKDSEIPMTATFVLDDFSTATRSRFGTEWIYGSDEVMDGSSRGQLAWSEADGRHLLRLSGEIETDTGFILAALPLVHSRYLFDARHFAGVELCVRSPEAEGFWLQLHSKELSMPWQHYRAPFAPGPDWQTLQIPFSAFVPVGTAHELNTERLNRLAIVAGQRRFSPDLEISEIGFY